MTWFGILLFFPCLDLGGCWVVASLWVAYHLWSPVVGQGTWESKALGFGMQFLIVCSASFWWLWLNSYGNAFS